MKRTGLMLLALILVGGLVFAAGCITAPASQPQSPEGKWILTDFGSNATPDHPMGVIDLQIAGTNVSGNSGVNQYFGTAVIDAANGKISFGPFGSTRMAGPENMMAQEQAYLAALANVTGYKITDGNLILTDAAGATILTFAVMPAVTLDGTSWTLAEDKNVTLEFTDGIFNGHAPVNLYSGAWYVTGTNGIEFGNVISTLMAGPTDAMNAESAYFKALANVTGYKITDDCLLLTDASGNTIMTFKENIVEIGITITGSWTLADDKNVTIDFDTFGEVSGKAPVNSYFGNVTITGTTISFGPIGSTKMAGPESAMNAESAYFAALANATGYKYGSSTLELTDADGNTLLTFVRTVNDGPISAKALPGMEKHGLVNEWFLTDDNAVTLTFSSDGFFGGHAPVNSYSGSYTETPDSLILSDVITTLMAGPEDAMIAESAYYAALGKVADYRVVDGRLYLNDAAGNTLLTFV
ncbi:META domain-containing protein [Methanorbis furvi]|uniref:DUF306 domain-containing protein n=1 Tax=Methanorbis furvi TaxID=3028299 RepID=A0AAE4MDL9_9EURY|nr:hypothetical protein [Methanocorpusculaceae archaeon Ag1]